MADARVVSSKSRCCMSRPLPFPFGFQRRTYVGCMIRCLVQAPATTTTAEHTRTLKFWFKNELFRMWEQTECARTRAETTAFWFSSGHHHQCHCTYTQYLKRLTRANMYIKTQARIQNQTRETVFGRIKLFWMEHGKSYCLPNPIQEVEKCWYSFLGRISQKCPTFWSMNPLNCSLFFG